MSSGNHGGSPGAILPTFFTQQQSIQEPTTTNEGNPERNWSGVLRGSGIDTKITRTESNGGTEAKSPNQRASIVEADERLDSTLEQDAPLNSQVNGKGAPIGKEICEEKPGNGNVWDIWPIPPRSIKRWDKPDPIPIAHVQIPAGSLAMSRPRIDRLPEGWTIHIHPEGKPYYHRDAREPEADLLRGTLLYDKGKPLCKPLPIVTDSDPGNPVTRKTLEHAHFIARITVAENDLELPEHTELFLELYSEREGDLHPYAGYYLADHDNQTIFWASPVFTSDLGVLQVNPDTFLDQHLKLQMGFQYWQHVECYPIDSNINIKEAEQALLEQLSFLYLDVTTSHLSTSRLTETQCQTFISMVQNAPVRRKTWTVSRLMSVVADWQFSNFYGHPSARLNRRHLYEVEIKAEVPLASDSPEQARIHPLLQRGKKKRTFPQKCYDAVMDVLLRICYTFLFEAPTAYNDALEALWSDKAINNIFIQNFIDTTMKDWGDISLLATVLWTANMAFLAIPYPILDPQQRQTLSETQNIARLAMVTISLTSTVFSIGSIALSLLHIRKHRMEHTAHDYRDFLRTKRHQNYGHRILAILWSLPFAFLMWSVLTFSAAVILFCVVTGLPGDLVPKVPLLVQSGFVLISMSLSIWYFWKREAEWALTAEESSQRSIMMILTNWWEDLKGFTYRFR